MRSELPKNKYNRGVAPIDFEVRSELATCDSVPRVRQARFEIGVRRNKSISRITVGVSLAFPRSLLWRFGPIETINKHNKSFPKHQEPAQSERWLCRYRFSAQRSITTGSRAKSPLPEQQATVKYTPIRLRKQHWRSLGTLAPLEVLPSHQRKVESLNFSTTDNRSGCYRQQRHTIQVPTATSYQDG